MNTDVLNRGLRGLNCQHWALVMLLGVGLATGCGDGGTADPMEGMTEDQQAIEMLVSSVADAGDLPTVRSKFTSEASPSQAEYNELKTNMYYVENIEVSGSTATFTVMIEEIGGDGSTVEKTWKATKEGENWKLTEAPLP